MMESKGRIVLTVWAILFVCLLSGPSRQVAAVTNPNDVTALTFLRDYWRSYPGNSVPSNWDGDDPCGGSLWAGVTCDASNTYVLNLSMINYNLSGGIPMQIADLSSLTYLDLSLNPLLGGQIPMQLGKLTSFVLLSLASCGLTGGFPQELGNLVNLDHLSLNQNFLSGPIPASVGKLKKMTWFDISENNFDSLPFGTATTVGVDNLTFCQHFHFYNNSFSGQLPKELFNLPSLLHLLLSFNQFSGSILPDTLVNAKQLTYLDLDNNQLSGPLPPQLNQITTLTQLRLSSNGFTSSLPDLSGLTNLGLLDVSHNPFDKQEIPPWVYSWNSATAIDMSFCNLNGTLNASIFSLPKIQSVDLANNNLSGTIQVSKPSSNLQLMNLENNQFFDFSGSAQVQSAVKVRLFGNPLCTSATFSGSVDCLQKVNLVTPFNWTDGSNAACPLSCDGGQTLNPGLCTCAFPLVCHMQLIQPYFKSINSAGVTGISSQFGEYFIKSGIVSDDKQVYIGSVNFTDTGLMLFDLSFFPPPGDSLNRTAAIIIVSKVNNNLIKLDDEGPYIVLNVTFPPFSSASGKSTSIGLIIGIVVAVVVVGVIIALIAAYAIRQKRRADKAEVSRPFASWGTTTKESGEAPELKGARWFTWADLKKATNDFSEDNEIGAGGYGKVYKGKLANGKTVAVKRADKHSVQGDVEFKNEIELLSRVHHKNLVGLVGFCYEHEEQALVYEFIPNGTLREHLLGHFDKPLGWDTRVAIALGSAKGLTYLHELANPPIIHRDIKSGNILLDESMTAKVADFGLSKLAPDGANKDHVSTQVKGTLGYLDPEYYMTNQLSEKSDVYSFGVVLLEMLSARPPIERGRYIVREVRTALNKGGLRALEPLLDPLLGDYPLKQLEAFLDLALQCVEEIAGGRPTMNEVVKKLEVIAGSSQPNSGVHITVEPQKELYEEEYLQGVDDLSFQYSGASFASSQAIEPK